MRISRSYLFMLFLTMHLGTQSMDKPRSSLSDPLQFSRIVPSRQDSSRQRESMRSQAMLTQNKSKTKPLVFNASKKQAYLYSTFKQKDFDPKLELEAIKSIEDDCDGDTIANNEGLAQFNLTYNATIMLADSNRRGRIYRVYDVAELIGRHDKNVVAFVVEDDPAHKLGLTLKALPKKEVEERYKLILGTKPKQKGKGAVQQPLPISPRATHPIDIASIERDKSDTKDGQNLSNLNGLPMFAGRMTPEEIEAQENKH